MSTAEQAKLLASTYLSTKAPELPPSRLDARAPGRLAYSINEFLAAASIGRTMFYDEVKEGRLRVAKVGKKTLIPHAEAEAWLRSLVVTPEELATEFDGWGRRRKPSGDEG